MRSKIKIFQFFSFNLIPKGEIRDMELSWPWMGMVRVEIKSLLLTLESVPTGISLRRGRFAPVNVTQENYGYMKFTVLVVTIKCVKLR